MKVPRIIYIDTQEVTHGHPLTFSAAWQTETVSLETGDYSIKGLTHRIAIERKSISDLMGSMTGDRPRLKREFERMRYYDFAALVIEGTWEDLSAGLYRSAMHPNAAFGSIIGFIVKYHITVLFAGNHERAGKVVEEIFHLYTKYIEEHHKEYIKGQVTQKAQKECLPATAERGEQGS